VNGFTGFKCGERCGFAACFGHDEKWPAAADDDASVGRPGRAHRLRLQLHNRHGRAAEDPDFSDLRIVDLVDEANPLAVRRKERKYGWAGASDGLGIELVDRAQVNAAVQGSLATDVRDDAAIG
jgi:hypothetical protein